MSYQGKCRGVRRDPYGLGASEKEHHREKETCSLTLKGVAGFRSRKGGKVKCLAYRRHPVNSGCTQ